MGDWAPRIALETVLAELTSALERQPDSIDARFARASILSQLGRTAEAEIAYRDVLARDPDHYGALTRLGVALRRSGSWTEARATFERAVRAHPQDAAARVNLANLLALTDTREAQQHYEAALRFQPDLAEAHQGLSALLALLGDEEGAARHRQAGFAGRAIHARRYVGTTTPTPAILLSATVGGNLDPSALLDEHVFLVHEVFADAYDPSLPLPPHRLIVNGIADADRATAALSATSSILERTTAPVLNRPAAVSRTTRLEISRRFAHVSRLVTARTALLPRATLEGEAAQDALRAAGFRYPLLLRSPGHHIGQHFVKLDSPQQLPHAVRSLPGPHLYVIEYLDVRSRDGNFRKYRVFVIDGTLYPAHLAVSSDWKVHYFSSRMAESQEYRDEEARFLDAMPAALGEGAMQALGIVARELGLEYAGIDFALSPEGGVVLFEANAAMTVYAPPAGERWAYRNRPTQRIKDALRAMAMRYCTPAT